MNAMILMPQISDVTANENARYKRNELAYENITNTIHTKIHKQELSEDNKVRRKATKFK